MTIQALNTRTNTLGSQERGPLYERCLRAREIERLNNVIAGDVIVCTRGVLWVTQKGDPEDYLLKEGERFVAKRLGLVVIQTFDDPACRSFINS